MSSREELSAYCKSLTVRAMFKRYSTRTGMTSLRRRRSFWLLHARV